MCRMVGYIGPPRDLASLIVTPAHGLVEQSWRPQRQDHGSVNADGWGVGWYVEGHEDAIRYRSVLPIWSDSHLHTLLPGVRSGLAIAAVRGATAPSPTQLSNTPPHASGKWLLAHNGLIDGYHDGVGEELRRTLTVGRASALEGSSDSELLLALVLERVARSASVSDALTGAIEQVLALAPARLNLIVSDGASLWATRAGDSLWIRDRVGDRGGVTVASEPDDDEAAWREVADDSLVTVTAGAVAITSLRAEVTEP